jgi:predicted ATPase
VSGTDPSSGPLIGRSAGDCSRSPDDTGPGVGVWLESVRIRGDRFPERGGYPFDVPALWGRQELHFSQSVAFLVGENGSGKSTLIEAMARRCGLHIWAQPKRSRPGSPGRVGSGHSGPVVASSSATVSSSGTAAARALADYLDVTLARGPVRGGVFSAESFREWAEFIDDVSEVDPGQAKYHGGEKLTLRSRGEGLLAYFRGRYQIPGLYFLDEPEAALSPGSQLELLRLLSEYRRRGHAQFIIATHSPILMAVAGAQIFALGEGLIAETTYEQTAHYRLYRDFMADPERFVSG